MGELLYIPKKDYGRQLDEDDINNQAKHIPCLLLRATNNSRCQKFALFFHGNAGKFKLLNLLINFRGYKFSK